MQCWPGNANENDLNVSKIRFEVLKRFRSEFLNNFRFFICFLSPRPVLGSLKLNLFVSSVYFFNSSFVLVEPTLLETSTSSSPNKIYTPLCSSSPKSSKLLDPQTSSESGHNQIDEGIIVEIEQEPTIETESPQATNESSFIQTLRIDEEIRGGNTSTTSTPKTQSPTGDNQEMDGEEIAETSEPTRPANSATFKKTIDEPYPDFAREVLGEFISLPGSQPRSHHFIQQLSFTNADEPSLENATSGLPEGAMGTIASSLHNADQQVPGEMEFDQNSPRSLTVTRQEAAALTDVLGRISHHFVAGEEPCPADALTLTVVDDYVQPTLFTTSSQEEMSAPTTSMSNPQFALPGNTNPRGKRRRPKYSLTLGMLKKHPILKFSATGPLDIETSPHKWWCRVCKVELSLMSLGSLEILSHYRSDAHLVKEHRIRMDVPGTPIYDKDGKELFGISLQEAKKNARETYPIAPQLDRCKPLVGQETVPAFSDVTNPSEKILFQISVIENGLRHGGNIQSLIGIYEGLTQLTNDDRLTTQDWSNQRLFVSCLFLHSNNCYILWHYI